nr:hypothetical protein [Tanacetum cinerariifolium]
MKDLGEAAYILGIKIYRDRSKRLIGLCQSAYIDKILKRYSMENSKRGSIHMQKKLKLSKSQGASTPAEIKRMQNVSYASAVGSIMYVVRCTRPDVAFAQNIKTDFSRIQTGYVFVLNGGAVDWKSVKQSIFATSSTEAKYIAAFDASKEAVWVRKFISGLSVVPIIEEPKSMYCDNTGAIAIANESGITKGARHFRAKVHYLQEVIEFGDIKLEKVHTDDNLADPFTIWIIMISRFGMEGYGRWDRIVRTPRIHRDTAATRMRSAICLQNPFEEPLILSIEDRVRPNKDDVLGRCMLPLEYVERRLDHKAINTRRFNLEKHVMVVEGEKKKEVKFASKIHMKYINPINGS